MTTFFSALLLFGLAIAGAVVRKTYYSIPARELKRKAAKGDPVAEKYYRAVAYGASLRSLLWVFIALTTAGGFVLLARIAPVWLSFLAVVALLWTVFSWQPAARSSSLGSRLTLAVTPPLVWILGYLYPILSRGAHLFQRRYNAPRHTGMYERKDLLELIDQQRTQSDSRLSPEELEITRRALSFDEYKVADVLIPRTKIKGILADDTIGPILIDELHKTEQNYAVVRDKPKGDFVGTLDVARLGLTSKGHIKDVMDFPVYYVHENDRLAEALHAFFVTNHPVFVVVNSFEEFVGILTVENMLKQLLGHVPGDEFDQYTDIASVAARHPKEKPSHKHDTILAD